MADIAKTCDIQVTKKRIAGLQLGVFVVVKTFCQVVTFWQKSISYLSNKSAVNSSLLSTLENPVCFSKCKVTLCPMSLLVFPYSVENLAILTSIGVGTAVIGVVIAVLELIKEDSICECQDGVPATHSQGCESDGQEKCASCYSGFHLYSALCHRSVLANEVLNSMRLIQ